MPHAPKHRICPYCHKPIYLRPSASERAKRYGGTPDDYRNLFTKHASNAMCGSCIAGNPSSWGFKRAPTLIPSHTNKYSIIYLDSQYAM